MRLIDADRTKAVMERTLEDLKLFFQSREQRAHLISAFYTVGDIVDNAPTIDAVPVVRCKDCKYMKDCIGGMIQCVIHHTWFKPDHYCAYGEREEVK